jgi:hypothetical protein
VSSTTIGHCIVCQRDIAVRPITAEGALHSHLLVHHGYNRPGIGCIVGDCFGVSMPPHELADFAARRYREWSELQYQREKERLRLLETFTMATVHVQVRVPVPTTEPRGALVIWGKNDPGWTAWLAPYYANETEPERIQIYQRICRSEADRTKSRMRMLDVEIARMLEVIPKWELKPLHEREKVEPDPARRRGRRRMRFVRGA